MKISDKQAVATVVHLSKNRAAAAPAQTPPQSADRVTLSHKARELTEARRALAALPDVRPEKVADIKARIEAGGYTVDAEAVAERILRDAFPEED